MDCYEKRTLVQCGCNLYSIDCGSTCPCFFWLDFFLPAFYVVPCWRRILGVTFLGPFWWALFVQVVLFGTVICCCFFIWRWLRCLWYRVCAFCDRRKLRHQLRFLLAPEEGIARVKSDSAVDGRKICTLQVVFLGASGHVDNRGIGCLLCQGLMGFGRFAFLFFSGGESFRNHFAANFVGIFVSPSWSSCQGRNGYQGDDVFQYVRLM